MVAAQNFDGMALGPELDGLTELASTLLGLRVMLLPLGERTQMTSFGASLSESFRATPRLLVVNDAPHGEVLAYAAVPLTVEDQVSAALCAVDTQPRDWSERELGVLSSVASAVEANMRLVRAHHALQEKHTLVMAVIDSFDDVLVVSEGEGKLILRNRAASEMLATVQPDMARTDWASEFGMFKRDRTTLHTTDQLPHARAMRGETVQELLFERSARAPEGRWHAVTAKPLRAADGTPMGAFSVSHDVTATESLNQQVREQAELLRNLVHALPGSAVLVFDQELRILSAEGPALAAIGLPSHALVRSTLGETKLGSRLERLFRAALAGQCGEAELTLNGRVMLVRTAPLSGPERGMALLSDITDRHREAAALRQAKSQLEEQTKLLVEQSLTDNLTGLNNRRGFLALAEHAMKEAQRDGQALLLFFIDMDGMKEINDRFGHDAGDRALLATADILRATFREVDVVARLGGDEFVVLAAHAPEHSAQTLTDRLDARLAEHNERSVHELSLSVGCASYDPASPVTVEQLLMEADVAMYQHKRSRRRDRASQPPHTL